MFMYLILFNTFFGYNLVLFYYLVVWVLDKVRSFIYFYKYKSLFDFIFIYYSFLINFNVQSIKFIFFYKFYPKNLLNIYHINSIYLYLVFRN